MYNKQRRSKNSCHYLASRDLFFTSADSPFFFHSLRARFDSEMELCTQVSSLVIEILTPANDSHFPKHYLVYDNIESAATITYVDQICNLNDNQTPVTLRKC